jgi:hypothetical protein
MKKNNPKTLMKVLALLLFALTLQTLGADEQLLFVEGQMVGGYSSLDNDLVLYSHHFKDAMQKPSLGFDYIRKFNNGYRDTGTLAIQYRVAYNRSISPRFESQIYNLYYKHKFPGFDVWLGSNKPAAGLPSYSDNHASLLSDMTMKVFNYDRDWGVGADLDKDWWRVSISATNGAGMRIYNKHGNYMLAARAGIGNFNKSNYTFGVTGVQGRVLEAMGYNLGHIDTGNGEYTVHPETYGGVDGSVRYLNYTLKFDALAGRFYDMPARALMVRAGANFLPEDKLTFEAQYLYSKHAIYTNTDLSGAIGFRITPDFTLRAMGNYHLQDSSWKVIGQIYYYKALNL